MFVYALGLVAAATPAVWVCGEAGPVSSFEVVGIMQITGNRNPLPARLQYVCPVGRAPSSVSLIVPNDPAIAFDFGSFLEPDAPAAGLSLSDITWTSASVRATMSLPADGEPVADTLFMLRTGHTNSGLGDLLASINAEPGTLAWTQTSFDDLSRRFVATFELDAASAASLKDAFEKCSSQQGWLPPL